MGFKRVFKKKTSSSSTEMRKTSEVKESEWGKLMKKVNTRENGT